MQALMQRESVSPQALPRHNGGVLTVGFVNEDELLRTALLIDKLGFASYETDSDGAALCALVDCSTASGLAVLRDLRAAPATGELPIIALIANPWSSEVAAVFEAGADDFVRQGVRMQQHLADRLAALRAGGGAIGSAHLGHVVVADPEGPRRAALARHLRKMGFDVRFALDIDEAAADPLVKLVVACGAPATRVAEARATHKAAGSVAPWIIAGDDVAIEEARACCGEEGVRYLDVETDTAQVVFLANQLLVMPDRSMRRSARLSYETPVAYRALDGGERTWGYTYNISRGGIYVRTLAPPPIGAAVVVEFAPPCGRGRVVVDGAVAWRQLPSDGRGLPPGFGLQFGEPAVADAAALEAGYVALANS